MIHGNIIALKELLFTILIIYIIFFFKKVKLFEKEK
jgi:hypothetical protein